MSSVRPRQRVVDGRRFDRHYAAGSRRSTTRLSSVAPTRRARTTLAVYRSHFRHNNRKVQHEYGVAADLKTCCSDDVHRVDAATPSAHTFASPSPSMVCPRRANPRRAPARSRLFDELPPRLLSGAVLAGSSSGSALVACAIDRRCRIRPVRGLGGAPAFLVPALLAIVTAGETLRCVVVLAAAPA